MLYNIVRTAYYSFHLYKFVMIVASHSEHVHCEFVTLVLTLLLENFYCDDKSSPMIAEIFQYNGIAKIDNYFVIFVKQYPGITKY